MMDTVYTPLPPPALPADFKLADPLAPKHEEMFKEVLAYFTLTEYVIPDSVGEKGQLTEEEKYWLVSLFWRAFHLNRWA